MRGLLGHDHGAPLAHAQHLVRPLQQVAGGGHILRPEEAQGLFHGVHVGGEQLLAHIGHTVLSQHLAGEWVAGGPPGGGVGHRQLEGVVALVIEPPGKAGNSGLRHAAGLRQLGDGHVLGFLLVDNDIVGHLFFGGGQAVVGAADFFKSIDFRHAPLLSGAGLCRALASFCPESLQGPFPPG